MQNTSKISIKNLLLLLTYRCNAKCKHCDIWKYREEEISLDDVKKLLEDPLIRNITHIELSGGEPFLRKDFKNILHAVESSLRCNIGISSNGLLTQKIINDLDTVTNKARITTKLSLDGKKEVHDKIRGIKNAFDKVMNTASSIKKKYPEITIEFLFTIMKDNYKEIIETYKYTKGINQEYKFTVGINQFVKNYKTKLRNYKEKEYRFEPKKVRTIIHQLKFLFNQYIQEKDYHEALFIIQVIRYLKNRPSRLYCSSPLEGLILTPDGKIYNCINEEAIGKFNGTDISSSIDYKKMKLHALEGLRKKCSQCVLRMGRFPSLYRFLPSFENYILKKK